MIQMGMRYHEAVNQPIITMASELWKRTCTKIDDDVRRSALNEVAAAPLSWIWPGGTASQDREVHSFQFLSVRALHVLAAGIVTEAGRRGSFVNPLTDAYTG